MSTTEHTPAGQGETQEAQAPRVYSQEEYDAMSQRLSEANREAAANRVKAKELEGELKNFQGTAEEKQKLAQRVEELNTSLTGAQERAINAEIKFLAKKLGAADPEDVVKLLDRSKLEVKDGDPVNAEKLVEDLLKSKPHLRGAAGKVDAGAKGGIQGFDGNAFLRSRGR